MDIHCGAHNMESMGLSPSLCSDVWIYDVKCRSGVDGPSKGYGMTLVAETMKGFHKGADFVVDVETQQRLSDLIGQQTENQYSSNSLLNAKQGIAEILSKQQTEASNEKKEGCEASMFLNPLASRCR